MALDPAEISEKSSWRKEYGHLLVESSSAFPSPPSDYYTPVIAEIRGVTSDSGDQDDFPITLISDLEMTWTPSLNPTFIVVEISVSALMGLNYLLSQTFRESVIVSLQIGGIQVFSGAQFSSPWAVVHPLQIILPDTGSASTPVQIDIFSPTLLTDVTFDVSVELISQTNFNGYFV